jgi:AraC-like DNA-binding protein
MIPTHSSEKTSKRGIVVNHLGQLNEYDFTEPHRHDYFEFFFFKKGGGVHYIDFIEFDIHDNSVHIVAPGQVHQMKRELDSEGYVVLFELSALTPPAAVENFLFEHICMDAGELNPAFRLNSELKDLLNSRIEQIYEYAQRGTDLDKLRLINELQLFCITCMEHAGDLGESVSSDYLNFRRALKDNFRELKKVKEYAELLNITERTLNDIAKVHSGKSASEVIYNQVIMEAKRLLRTGISVKETAYALNFDDPGHFSKFFKNKTGSSPSDFQDYT